MTKRPALSLAELMIVLTILVLLAALIVPLATKATEDAQEQATQANLVQLRDVIMNAYRVDMRDWPRANDSSPAKLLYLFVKPAGAQNYDPIHRLGWKGPYLLQSNGVYLLDVSRGFTTSYGANDDPTVLDGWLNPIVIQQDTATNDWWLVSAGPDGSLNTTTDNLRLKLQ